jgi:ornithine cyclodeaminase/alanine dehydrogenase-like protein (mu-crystallin family)
MTSILVLSREEMSELLTLEVVVPAIEDAFIAFAAGRCLAYPVVREQVEGHQGIFGIKSGYLIDDQVLGLKAGGYWRDNPALGLTAHQSMTLLFDPATGVPTAFMDGNHITTIRTAAVGALAARALARPGSSVAAVLGCGVQGTAQAEALCHVLPIRELRVFDPSAVNRRSFIERLGSRVAVTEAGDGRAAVAGSDVVITAVGGRAPVLFSDWVGAGVHINAFGTDTRGKIEIETSLFRRARLVVDDVAQACALGETQAAIDAGLLDREGPWTTLGEVLSGVKPGRTRNEEITLFDATGLAFQDLVAASLAVKLANERGLGRRISL